MSMSPYTLEQSLRYYLTASTVNARPTTWEISLHSGDPGPDAANNEIAYAGYARQSASFSVDVTDPDAAFAANSALIEFPVSATPYTVTHVAVWGGADALVIQQLNSSKTITAGVKAQFAPGEITIGGRN